MPNSRTTAKVMGVTFILTGVFFFVIGIFMLITMGIMSSMLAAFSAFGTVDASGLGTIVTLGWLFSAVTFLAGIFSIISAAMLFTMKED